MLKSEITELEVDETAMVVVVELLCAVELLAKPVRKQFGGYSYLVIIIYLQISPQVLRYHLHW